MHFSLFLVGAGPTTGAGFTEGQDKPFKYISQAGGAGTGTRTGGRERERERERIIESRLAKYISAPILGILLGK